MLKKYWLLFSIIFLLLQCQGCAENEPPSLILTIRSNKEIYTHGDSIEISYTIKNIGSEPVGFYIVDNGNIELEAFELSGNSLEYYFHPSWQRMMPSLYPDEYVLLGQDDEWKWSEIFPLRKGIIQDYPEATSKADPGLPTIVHDGFYIDLPSQISNDHILIAENFGGKISFALEFSATDPNPKQFSIKDCEEVDISLDAFPEELSSNRIHHSVLCEGGACPDLDDEHNLQDPKLNEDIHDLAMYCQHWTVLSKDAWVGTLHSNTITIEIFE